MFKFVVVFAFVAAAVAEPEPGVLLSAPYVQPYAAYSTVLSPGSTSYSSSSSSVIHPSPLTYSSPLGFSHFIKKRSADPQWLASTYSAPYSYYPASYQYTSPALAPTVYSSSWSTLGAHLIKKRSADPQWLASTYSAPATYLANSAYSPVISSPYLSTPYYGAQLPLLNSHFIKKRSAEATPEPAADPQFLASSYVTPYNSYYNTIASPYIASPLLNNYYSASAAIPLASTHFIKKRSADAKPEPAAQPAADPQLFQSYPYLYPGSSLYSSAGFPASTYINGASLYSTNPYVYSSYIKK